MPYVSTNVTVNQLKIHEYYIKEYFFDRLTDSLIRQEVLVLFSI